MAAQPIRAYVRVRGGSTASSWCVQEEHGLIVQVDPASGAALPRAAPPYSVDAVFDGEQPTAEVYRRTTQPLVRELVAGINATVMAYGQTSSGKTHTMLGSKGEGATEPGIIPLALQDVFALIGGSSDGGGGGGGDGGSSADACQGRTFELAATYMEVHGNDIRDLLVPACPGSKENAAGNRPQPAPAVHETAQAGVVVTGLHEVAVTMPQQVLELLERGSQQRQTGDTRMNAHSSRSHAIFRLRVESWQQGTNPDDADAQRRVSMLTLVDLAGSERVAKTGAAGQRLKEGAAINKALTALGSIVQLLSEQQGHVRYRDSTLTHILKPSLGGNARTAIICTINPAAAHAEETRSTLAFACRVQRVVNTATVNNVLSYAALARRVKELEREAAQTQQQGEAYAELQRAHQELEQQLVQVHAELAAATAAAQQAAQEKDMLKRRATEAAQQEQQAKRQRLAADQGLQQRAQQLEQQLAEAQAELVSTQAEQQRLAGQLQQEQDTARQCQAESAHREAALEIELEELSQAAAQHQRQMAALEQQLKSKDEESLQLQEQVTQLHASRNGSAGSGSGVSYVVVKQTVSGRRLDGGFAGRNQPRVPVPLDQALAAGMQQQQQQQPLRASQRSSNRELC